MDTRATIARITAQRLGCKDDRLLKLIERLATSDIAIESASFKTEVDGNFYVIAGKLDAKRFSLIIGGEAMADFT